MLKIYLGTSGESGHVELSLGRSEHRLGITISYIAAGCRAA